MWQQLFQLTNTVALVAWLRGAALAAGGTGEGRDDHDGGGEPGGEDDADDLQVA